MLKDRFSSLKELRLRLNGEKDFDSAASWVHVCCILHNMGRQHDDSELESTDAVGPNIPWVEPGAHCSGRGSHGWKGRGPSAVDSIPSGRPQNIPIRASKGMTCPNLREIGSVRGRGFSLVVFPTPLLLV